MNYYNEISEGYEELHKEEQLRKVKVIKNHLKVSASNKLLDVGCGTGITTAPWPCKRWGIDPAENLLKKAKLKTKIKYVKGVAESLPFKNNFFDIVISITAIQNFDNIEKSLKEIKRVGKNKFVLSFLKKSRKKPKIHKFIKKHFKIKEIIEEDKDMIYII